MKKYNILIIILLLPLFLSGCLTYYGFQIYNENLSNDDMRVRIFSDDSLLLLVQMKNPFHGNEIRNIEFINGIFEVGDVIYNFNKEEINISVNIWYEGLNWFNEENYHNRYNIINNFLNNERLIDRMGIRNANNIGIYNLEDEKHKILQSASHILFFKRLSKSDILQLYKQNNKNGKLLFEYNIIMDNNIANIQINEDFAFEGWKSSINIFNFREHF